MYTMVFDVVIATTVTPGTDKTYEEAIHGLYLALFRQSGVYVRRIHHPGQGHLTIDLTVSAPHRHAAAQRGEEAVAAAIQATGARLGPVDTAAWRARSAPAPRDA